MKKITALGISALALAALSFTTGAEAKVSREAAVKKCVSGAQSQVPDRQGDENSVQTARLNIYKSCMKGEGYRP